MFLFITSFKRHVRINSLKNNLQGATAVQKGRPLLMGREGSCPWAGGSEVQTNFLRPIWLPGPKHQIKRRQNWLGDEGVSLSRAGGGWGGGVGRVSGLGLPGPRGARSHLETMTWEGRRWRVKEAWMCSIVEA